MAALHSLYPLLNFKPTTHDTSLCSNQILGQLDFKHYNKLTVIVGQLVEQMTSFPVEHWQSS